jgi:hypothetical protein
MTQNTLNKIKAEGFIMKERILVNALNIFGCMVFFVCVYLIYINKEAFTI